MLLRFIPFLVGHGRIALNCGCYGRFAAYGIKGISLVVEQPGEPLRRQLQLCIKTAEDLDVGGIEPDLVDHTLEKLEGIKNEIAKGAS